MVHCEVNLCHFIIQFTSEKDKEKIKNEKRERKEKDKKRDLCKLLSGNQFFLYIMQMLGPPKYKEKTLCGQKLVISY